MSAAELGQRTFLQALQRLSELGWDERAAYLEQHQEFFEPAALSLMEVIERDLQARGLEQAAGAMARMRDLFERCQRLGVHTALAQDEIRYRPINFSDELAAIRSLFPADKRDSASYTTIIEKCDRLIGHSMFTTLPVADRVSALYARAAAFRAQGNEAPDPAAFDRAIGDFLRIIELDPPKQLAPYTVWQSLAAVLAARYWKFGDTDAAISTSTILEKLLRQLPGGSPERIKLLSNYVGAAYERYLRHGDEDALKRAVKHGEELLCEKVSALEDRASHSALEDRASHIDVVSAIYRSRYDRDGNDPDLDRAIELGEQAISLSSSGRSKLKCSINLSGALAQSYVRRQNKAHLHRAIELSSAVVSGLSRSDPAWRKAAHNLATGLRLRAALTGEPDDLDKAIRLHEDAANGVPPDEVDALLYLGGVANAYKQRFTQMSSIDDLDNAIKAYELALEKTAPRQPERARLNNNLGNTLADRYELRRHLPDLRAAIDCFRKSLEILPITAPEQRRTLMNLGGALSRLYEGTSDDHDYEEATRFLTEAKNLLSGSADLAGVLDNQAGTLLTRYRNKRQVEDLDELISLLDRAVSIPGIPGLINDRKRSLAQGLALRYLLHSDDKDRSRAQNLFRETTDGPSVNAGGGLFMTLTRADFAFKCATAAEAAGAPELALWNEAVEACEIATARTGELLQRQFTRRHRAAWLRVAQPLPRLHAYCLTRLGEIERAVEALEGGRSLFFAEALDRNRADLEHLESIGQSGLLDLYRRAIAAAQVAEQQFHLPSDMESLSAHRISREEATARLQAAVDAIRKIDGYRDFQRPLRFDEIRKAAESAPIIYLCITSEGGFALIVSAAGIDDVPLRCTQEELIMWIVGEGSNTHSSFLGCVVDGHSDRLRIALARLLPKLGDQLIRPVAEFLREKFRFSPNTKPLIRLVPTGLLTLLPLHAATYETTDGSATLLDEFAVSYLPSARVLRLSVTPPPTNRCLLALGDPAPLPSEICALQYARFEAMAVSQMFPDALVPLIAEAATVDALGKLWGNADIVHLACHASFVPNNPLQSALILAEGKVFTLAQIMSNLVSGKSPHWVVLSACQTALSEFLELPEEVIGFPVGLIQAGAQTVIGTLWPVEDWSTSLLMAKFAEAVSRNGLSPAAALCSAQRWLRKSDCATLETFADRLLVGLPSDVADPIRERILLDLTLPAPDERPFSNSYYWAGFTCWGVS
jgi:CHAT domain-containing protein/tetratricopeptide (TPR) repeat protein